jgi:MerR family transcriptional regulator, light-induced transcriptional regulator
LGDHRDPALGGVSLLGPAGEDEQADVHHPRDGADDGADGADDSVPTLPVAAVARRLGVAPATLRTWDRRYGIGPRGHTTGRHRRYAPADIARLELMQQALLRGATPAEAADYALRAGRLEPEPEDVATRIIALREPMLEPSAHLRSASVLGISRAAMAMDAVATHQLIVDSVRDLGVVAVWDGVLVPVLAALACRGAHPGDGVEVEHMVNECVLAAMLSVTPLVTAQRNPRPVLLCGAPGDRPGLALYVLRAALAQARIGTQMLGADLPAAALAAAVRRTGPAAVVVWAQRSRRDSAEVFGRVPRTRQRTRLFACGPGWLTDDLPGRVERLDDLAAAVRRIEDLVAVAR